MRSVARRRYTDPVKPHFIALDKVIVVQHVPTPAVMRKRTGQIHGERIFFIKLASDRFLTSSEA